MSNPPRTGHTRRKTRTRPEGMTKVPKTSKTDVAVPTAEMIIHVVTWNLSVIKPIITQPIIADIFVSMTVNVESKFEAPKAVRA